MKGLFGTVAALLLCSCSGSIADDKNAHLTNDQQIILAQQILTVASLPSKNLLTNDSMAFLLVPVEASCPSCRKKTIDSILTNKNTLPNNHYIVITAKSGRKNINAYFKERKGELPYNNNNLIIDSSNLAGKLKLYKSNPAIYYMANQKIYKQVHVTPYTIAQDLHEYFAQ